MGFYRQLDYLVTTLTTLVVFVGCTFYLALPVKVSLLIAAVVFIGGLIFGRQISSVLRLFFGIVLS
jgi:hypothetical protein